MKKQLLCGVLASLIGMGAYGHVALAESPTDLIDQNEYNGLIVGKKLITDKENLKKAAKSVFIGDTNTIEVPSDSKDMKDITLIGSENTFKPTKRDRSYRAKDVVLIGSRNTVDYNTSSEPYNAVIVGSQNKLISTDREGSTISKGLSRNVIVGAENESLGAANVMVGWKSSAKSNGISIGTSAKSGNHSIAMGLHAESRHSEKVVGGSVAIAHTAKAYGSNSVAIGYGSSVAEESDNALSLGAKSSVSSKDAVALGTRASVGENAVAGLALGKGASVAASEGVALGAGSVVTSSMQNQTGYNFEKGTYYEEGSAPTYAKETTGSVSVGSKTDNIYRRITNVAAGRDDVDAVNVGQLKDAMKLVAKGASDDTASVASGMEEKLTAMDTKLGNSVGSLARDLEQTKEDTNRGLANVAALSALHLRPYEEGDKLQLMIGLGMHKGKKAVALGGGYHINEDATATLGIAFGSGHSVTSNLGLTMRIGKKTPKATTHDDSRMRELEEKVERLEQLLKAYQN